MKETRITVSTIQLVNLIKNLLSIENEGTWSYRTVEGKLILTSKADRGIVRKEVWEFLERRKITLESVKF